MDDENKATVTLSEPVEVTEGSLTDTWVVTLLQNVIAQIVLSLQNCDIDLGLVETLQCEFKYGDLPVRLSIELGERDENID